VPGNVPLCFSQRVSCFGGRERETHSTPDVLLRQLHHLFVHGPLLIRLHDGFLHIRQKKKKNSNLTGCVLKMSDCVSMYPCASIRVYVCVCVCGCVGGGERVRECASVCECVP